MEGQDHQVEERSRIHMKQNRSDLKDGGVGMVFGYWGTSNVSERRRVNSSRVHKALLGSVIRAWGDAR